MAASKASVARSSAALHISTSGGATGKGADTSPSKISATTVAGDLNSGAVGVGDGGNTGPDFIAGANDDATGRDNLSSETVGNASSMLQVLMLPPRQLMIRLN